MEDVGATTTDTGEQQLDSSKPRKTTPQRLKTSEKRRVQNRAAQKTYREKQKRRLQTLELYAKSHTTVPQDEVAFSTPASTVGPDVAGMLGVIPDLLQHHLPAPDLGINNLVSYNSSLNAGPSGGSVPSYDYVPGSILIQDELFSASETRLASIPGSDDITPKSSLGSSLEQARGESHKDSEVDCLLAQFLLQDDVTLSRGLLRDIQKHKITLRDVLRLGLQSLEGKSPSTAGGVRVTESSLQQRAYIQLPDLHANTIRLTQMSFVAAVLHNASMLGISASEIFAQDATSRFCASSGAAERVPQEPALDHIKEHLRPTQNQLTHRHHPYIDTLPFRVFRERLIAVIHAQPPIINMPELCHDLQSDGVVCWGSSAGAGTGHSGAPWDIRSWEVRPWFLKKWWMLTEGADGEMYQQARWWCEMRGEEMAAVW
ncbi:hypothetical protein ACQKWADRAFT_282695 [Trichoderma austrokoningii]